MVTLFSEIQNHPSAAICSGSQQEEVPDYYRVIEHPIDLATIEQKLKTTCI